MRAGAAARSPRLDSRLPVIRAYENASVGYYYHDAGDGTSALLERKHLMSDEKKTYKFVCVVCGYEVEVDTPELPEDFVCPVCGVGPDQFELVEE